MTDSHGNIPGFTPEQAWALRALIRDAVREANDHDTRVAQLETCVFGNGVAGLKVRLTKLEEQVSQTLWLTRAVLGAGIASFVSLIISNWG